MCHVCNKVYCQGSTLSRHLKKTHQFKWPSGHNKFRYKLDEDGYYRLQTLRYESIDLTSNHNDRDDENEIITSAVLISPPQSQSAQQQQHQHSQLLNLTSMQLDLKDISLSEISGENNHRHVYHNVITGTNDENTRTASSAADSVVGTLFYNNNNGGGGMSFLNQSYHPVEILDTSGGGDDNEPATGGFVLTHHHHHHPVSTNSHLFSTVLDDVNIF